jgi:hypothetical protein
MKIITILIFMIFFESHSQENLIINPKIDTLYNGKYIPNSILKSKMNLIINDIPNLCKKSNYNRELNISNKREYVTLSILEGINSYLKTNLFTDYNALIVAYFCDNVDIVDEIYLFEFHFSDISKSKKCINFINRLYKDINYGEYIGTKNWLFYSETNKVYFLMGSSNDNIMINELKERMLKNK